jgi:predicted amidophosphoribosyltransferase
MSHLKCQFEEPCVVCKRDTTHRIQGNPFCPDCGITVLHEHNKHVKKKYQKEFQNLLGNPCENSEKEIT